MAEPVSPHSADRILIKLKPAALTSGPQKMSGATLGVAGLGEMKRIFPTSTAPIQKASSDGTATATPDLRLWMEAAVVPGADITAVVQAAQQSSLVATAEPDYIYRLSDIDTPSAAFTESSNSHVPQKAAAAVPTTTSDPLLAQQWHLDFAQIKDAWAFLQSHGKEPGGSRDVVIAIIDSGVDLTHPEIGPNLWTNGAEVAGDGVDNDGNGVVDDVHGARFVGQTSGDPTDDNGHGTHVAGLIAAAANNGIGGVGVAFNCQIMPLKAADSTGALGTSAIAQAIQYAVTKGADVINMSFGGSSKAQVIEDALILASARSVLVAAAGNSSRPTETPATSPRPFYPAGYSFVVGVMAHKPTPTNGDYLASFSNWDSAPGSRIEYEIMAPGTAILSTLPGGQYAAWNGTSMATPIVSGVAALVRSQYPDRVTYGGGFIASQLLNAATTLQGITPPGSAPLNYRVLSALQAVASSASPNLSYVEHYVFDSPSVASQNDGDGVVDAGEVVDLAVVLRNVGGKGNPVIVKLEALASGSTTPDPYVTWAPNADTVDYGAVGDFNEDDNGLIYTNGIASGVAHPFRMTVSANAPNDYVIPIKVTITATNGYNASDPHGPYVTTSRFNLVVQRGAELKGVISESKTLTKDRLWIVSAPTLVPSGVSITVEPGAQLKVDYPLQIEGGFYANGTAASQIEIFGTGKIDCVAGLGTASYRYCRITGTTLAGATALIYRCDLRDVVIASGASMVPEITESRFTSPSGALWAAGSWNLADRCLFQGIMGAAPFRGSLTDSVFLGSSVTIEARYLSTLKTNSFLSKFWNGNPFSWVNLTAAGIARETIFDASNNFWGTASDALIESSITDFYDGNFSQGEVRYLPKLTTPSATAWPHVANVALSTPSGSNLTRVGAEAVTFTVTFNRDMNTTKAPEVSFGPQTPATTYTVTALNGGWQNPRTWTGRYVMTRFTGDGYNYIRVANAVAASDPWLVSGDDDGRFRFEVITAGVETLALRAVPGVGKVDLTWTQDDFDLLAGYHLYRATAAAGPYTRLNTSIIPAATKQYQDLNVQPGQLYYYKFTVVQTDMSESAPSNVDQAAPVDTIKPVIVHSPPSTAEPNLTLSLSAAITDNVHVTGATLYYRVQGQTTYQSRTMVNVSGSQWVVALEGSLVVSPGVEYYLAATDAVSTTFFGLPEQPYLVAVPDKPLVSGVSPATGGIAGGDTITISGSNFKAGARVFFGGIEATNVVVVSSSQITCRAPTSVPAKVSVRVDNLNGSSSTLVNAYTFIDATPTLLVPDQTANSGAIVTVPLNVANLSGLLSARVVLSFDPAQLHYRSAAAGSLATGSSYEFNLPAAGQVRISMATATPTQGNGSLAQVEFDVLAGPGQVAAITITEALLNDGAITPRITNGSITTSPSVGIAGRVYYWADSSRAVPGVTLTLEGAGTRTATSGADGSFSLTNLQNAGYILRAAKANQIDGITAYDAALVLRHDVGLAPLTGNALVAADVNLTGTVTPQDASQILQHAAGLQAITIPTAGTPWAFAPASRTYATLTANQTGQDFAAILRGDVSGNWLNSTAQGGVAAKMGVALVPDVAGNRTIAYVLLQNPSAPVYGVDAILSYGAQAQLLSVTGPAAISALNTATAGQILAALVKVNGYTGNQILLVATFQGTTDPQLQIQSLILNEGAVLAIAGADPAAFDADGNGLVDPYGVPIIKTQPASQTVNLGGAATFTVVVAGNPAPTFQWRKNSGAISGATNATLALANVQAGDAGSYDVVVSNSEGSVTSAGATLALSVPGEPPVITTQPAAQAVNAGQTASFMVAASGTAPLAYQWRKNGTAIGGATNATLTLANVQAGDAGNYSVVVSNTVNVAMSNNVTLTVYVAPTITTQPLGQTVNAGQGVTLGVVAAGTAPLNYQWRKDGADLAGATSATLSLSSVQASDAGSYAAVVSNSVGSVTSSVAVLTVNPSVPPASGTHAVVGPGYVAGGAVTLTNTITYTGILSELQWHVLLPTGWSYGSDSGSAGAIKPVVGATDLAEWTWTTVPASPFTFTYTLSVPVGTTGVKTLAALVRPRQAGVQTQVLVQPDPLTVSPAQRHSADTDGNFRLSLVELTRVIELYNTRLGTIRTGRYKVQAGTEDGFAADPLSTSNQVLAGYHSADSNANGQLTLTELTRVIELYNYRVGTTRTGQYHIQAGTEDGLAPGP